MKSAAFNLAFKVHRNEVPFADGLLQSCESNAQHDFIEALNSLAGSQKYDINQLDSLIAQAKSSLSGDSQSASSANLEKLEKEVRDLKGDIKDYKSSIHMLEANNSTLMTTIIPGINSFLLFFVGIVILLILFAVDLMMPALIVLVLVVIGGGVLLFMDLEKLKKQRAVIEKKREKNLMEIDKLQGRIEETKEDLAKKQEEIARISQPQQDSQSPTMDF
jgi:prefoldin subunit 5